jgi:molecular chaperone Hsp33
MEDYVYKAYCYGGYVRVYAARSTNLVEEMRKCHGTWPTASAALGRSLTIASIMSLMYKAGEHLTIRINGQGPIGEMVIEAHDGIVKGSIQNPEVNMQYKNGHLAVGPAVGVDGDIIVTKDLHMRQPFSSFSQLQTGEIGDDFAYYFTSSEQIPSAVGVGVLVNPDNSIKAAGGFILQLMPGCSPELISKIEENIKNLKPVSEMIDLGYTPEDMIKEITKGDFELLEKKEIKYYCDCSKEKFRKGLLTLGSKEIKKIIDEDSKAEVMCHFCMKKYNYTKEDLEEIYNECLKQGK